MSISFEENALSGWRFVKLGGSLITDKATPETVREDVLERLASELAMAVSGGHRRLLVGHGSGSFGHMAAARHGLTGGRGGATATAIAAVQDAAARLHRRVVASLQRAGAPSFSLAPGSFIVAGSGRVRHVECEALLLVEKLGLLPVVYGDVVSDRDLGATILSTEAVFLAIADWLAARGEPVREVLWLGATEGVHDPEGRLVDRLAAREAEELAPRVGGAAGIDVTGGISLRLQAAAWLGRRGVASRIIDGRIPGRLGAALAGETVPGTIIEPPPRGS